MNIKEIEKMCRQKIIDKSNSYDTREILAKFTMLCTDYKKQYKIPSSKDLVIARRIAIKLDAINHPVKFYEYMEDQIRSSDIPDLSAMCKDYRTKAIKSISKNKGGDYVL